MRPRLIAILGLAALFPRLTPAGADEWQWTAVSERLPAGLSGRACQSQPLTCGNPLLQKVNEQLYAVPWAPGEAVLLQLRPGASVNAFGFWRSPREYLLLVRQGRQWRPGRGRMGWT